MAVHGLYAGGEWRRSGGVGERDTGTWESLSVWVVVRGGEEGAEGW